MNPHTPPAVGDTLGRTESAVCQKMLDALAESLPEMIGAVVSTADGFEIAAKLSQGLSPATLSAMTSSQLALAEAMSAETGLGRCINVVIEADRGKLVMVDIPGRGQKRLLTVLCADKATLGAVLWPVRRCAAQIGERLDASFD